MTVTITTHWELMGKYQSGQSFPAPFPDNIVGLICTAYLCPQCGSLWARIFQTCNPASQGKAEWFPKGKPCPSHGDGRLLAFLDFGRLTVDEIRERYPASLLEYELAHIRRNGR